MNDEDLESGAPHTPSVDEVRVSASYHSIEIGKRAGREARKGIHQGHIPLEFFLSTERWKMSVKKNAR